MDADTISVSAYKCLQTGGNEEHYLVGTISHSIWLYFISVNQKSDQSDEAIDSFSPYLSAIGSDSMPAFVAVARLVLVWVACQ